MQRLLLVLLVFVSFCCLQCKTDKTADASECCSEGVKIKTAQNYNYWVDTFQNSVPVSVAYLPGAFTPNGDIHNEVMSVWFYGMDSAYVEITKNSTGASFKKFSIKNGVTVQNAVLQTGLKYDYFEWDGKMANGTVAPEGGYTFHYFFKSYTGEIFNGDSKFRLMINVCDPCDFWKCTFPNTINYGGPYPSPPEENPNADCSVN